MKFRALVPIRFFCVLLVGAFLLVYGSDGLAVSAGLSFPDLMTGNIFWNGDTRKTTGAVLLAYLLTGLLSILVTAAVTLLISSIKKSSFSALLWSAAAYLFPAVIYTVFLVSMKVTRALMILKSVINCLPFFLPMRELTSIPFACRLFGYVFSACLLAFCCLLGWRKYCRCQVGK